MTIVIESEVKAIGLLIQGNPIEQAKEAAVNYIKEHTTIENPDIAYSIEMPCGQVKNFITLDEVRNLPIKDIPCSCGNPNHWFVKFDEWS